MATDHILALLLAERDKIIEAIAVLEGTKGAKPGPDRKTAGPSVERDSKQATASATKSPAKRQLSAAGRKAIVDATKKRWAALRAAKASSPAVPAAGTAKPESTTKKASPANAAFRKKMSERMKTAWVARKKKAVAKKS